MSSAWRKTLQRQKNYISFRGEVKRLLVIVFGLPGTGKSYFAKRLAEQLSAMQINSDSMRNEMLARGHYETTDRLLVYQQMRKDASAALRAGQSVVVDATFTIAGTIDMFTDLSTQFHCQNILFEIVADESLVRKRLKAHRNDSEADYEVYLKLKETMLEPSKPFHTIVSTDDNIADMLDIALTIIRQHEQ